MSWFTNLFKKESGVDRLYVKMRQPDLRAKLGTGLFVNGEMKAWVTGWKEDDERVATSLVAAIDGPTLDMLMRSGRGRLEMRQTEIMHGTLPDLEFEREFDTLAQKEALKEHDPDFGGATQ